MSSLVAPKDALAALWRSVGLPEGTLESIALMGAEPALPSSFAVGTAAQASIAASALGAAELWRLRTGRRQRVAVDMRHAAIEFRSERYLRVAGEGAKSLWDPIAGLYPTAKSGFVRLHTNFPHHRDAVLSVLGCEGTREAVAAALAKPDAVAFESEA